MTQISPRITFKVLNINENGEDPTFEDEMNVFHLDDASLYAFEVDSKGKAYICDTGITTVELIVNYSNSGVSFHGFFSHGGAFTVYANNPGKRDEDIDFTVQESVYNAHQNYIAAVPTAIERDALSSDLSREVWRVMDNVIEQFVPEGSRRRLPDPLGELVVVSGLEEAPAPVSEEAEAVPSDNDVEDVLKNAAQRQREEAKKSAKKKAKVPKDSTASSAKNLNPKISPEQLEQLLDCASSEMQVFFLLSYTSSKRFRCD